MKSLLLLVLSFLIISCGSEVEEDPNGTIYSKACQAVSGIDSIREVITYNSDSTVVRYGAFYYRNSTSCESADVVAGIRYSGSVSSNSLSLTNLGAIIVTDATEVSDNNSGTVCGFSGWTINTVHTFIGGTPDFSTGSCAGSVLFYDQLFLYSRFNSEEVSTDATSFVVDADNSKGFGVQTFVLLTGDKKEEFTSKMNALFSY